MITDNIEKVVEEEDEYFDSEIEPSVTLPIILNDKFASPINALKEKISVVNDLNESITTINSPLITNKTTIKEIYAVSFADKSINSNSECCRIFINRENAMKLCRQDPQNRRFKNFRSFKEAYAFSYESNEIESGQVPTIRQVHASLAASLTTTITNGDVQLSPQLMQIDSKTPSQDAEKLPFSGPKKIEINEMRSFIEKNNLEAFSARINSNPRFLISAGDSPIIFQESFRYNALHICAKENRPEICEFLLKTLNSVAFIQKLYVNDSIEQSRTRSQHLLDLYINMPEKGLNETPLHFACKFGSLEVVRQIISFDVCSRNQLNKNQKTAQDLICTKTTNKQNFSEIKSLFEDCLYLPLYRDYESSSVIIEKPCAKLEPEFENTNKTNNKTPNRYVNRSQHRLAAYVGPISPTNANAIYERLKSPAKLRQSPSNLDILRSDEYKGYERIVRKITDEMNMPWTEYWSFLDSFCDFKKNEGLTKLEVYLEQKKFQNILESQVQSVINMLKTNRLNEAIVNKLNEFMQVVDDLKRALDLKENQLSYTYEHIFKTAKCLQNFTLPLTFKSNKHEDELNENELNFFNVILPHYMTVIIDLSKTDKCYFNLYKTSKCLLELLNCQKMFEQFYLSPIFKEKCGNLNGKSKKKKSSNKPKYNLSSDDEEEEDEENDEYDNENDIYEDDLNQDEMIGTNMDESYITSENVNKKDDTDDLSNLLSNFSLNPKEPELNNKQESKENNTSVTPFRRPTNNPYINNNNNNNNFKLFMFGDQPSKLDRAVYLCIESNKSCRIDLSYYPILNEWFNYMKSVDKNEMTSWKTPMKKKEPLKCKVINSMNI